MYIFVFIKKKELFHNHSHVSKTKTRISPETTETQIINSTAENESLLQMVSFKLEK